MKLVLSLGLSLLLLAATWAAEGPEKGSLGEASTFEIAPAPAWVKVIEAPEEVAAGIENTGMVYLLVDRQENLERKAIYYHEVRQVTSENGLESAAAISLSFDPAAEKLTLHSLQLVRAGQAANRLDRSAVRVSQREKDPLRANYEPSYSVDLSLNDVRVGDRIEYSYTREGGNPRLGNRYASTHSLQWDVWIGRNVLRLVYPEHHKLNIQAQNGAAQPTITTAAGVSELVYEAKNVPARVVENDVPNGYTPRRRLETTDFASWAELAQWAAPLFETGAPSSPEFGAEIQKLRAILDLDQRVVAALQFVQDEIRDVSISSWVGDHAVTSPDEIVRRRAADDKDKAVLLVALLRGGGIDAAPALVSDYYRDNVRAMLPSPDLFDHVIVQVKLGKNVHWIDPWRSRQRGPLAQVYVARYGHALVLRPAVSELSAFTAPPTSWPVKKIVETYRVAAPGEAGELDVVSDYEGLAADQIRSTFRSSTREEIQKGYLDYYARNFRDLKTRKALWFEELPGINACRVSEAYEIPDPWQLSEDKERYLFAVSPGDILSALGSVASPQRVDPLIRSYPNKVIEQINLELFEPWSPESKPATTATEYFKLRDEPKVDGSHVQFDYAYESRTDRVEPAGFARYNEAVNKAKETLGYTLRYSTPAQLEKARKPTTFNWAVGAAGVCFLVSAILWAVFYFRASRLSQPRPPPLETPARLNGIGGWLILLGIGHVLRPLGYLKTGRDLYRAVMDTNSWRWLADPIEAGYHAWWAPTLLFELFFNLAGLVFCFLLVALFFRKRAVWPRCLAAFLIFNLAGAILDWGLIHQIPAAAGSLGNSLRAIASTAVAALIWIPYLFLSKRVRATFRY